MCCFACPTLGCLGPVQPFSQADMNRIVFVLTPNFLQLVSELRCHQGAGETLTGQSGADAAGQNAPSRKQLSEKLLLPLGAKVIKAQ